VPTFDRYTKGQRHVRGTSIADPEHFDLDSAFHFDTYLDPTFYVDTYLDPTFYVDTYLDPTFYVDTYLDPTFYVDTYLNPTFHVDTDPDLYCFKEIMYL
jgi:hypothetical protein